VYRVDPARRDLVEEYLARPFGPHSLELQRLALQLRLAQPAGKLVALTVARHRAWRIGVYAGQRGTPVRPWGDAVYHSLADINRAIFLLQWEAATGAAPPAADG
jgi:hypothetical protein